MTTSSATDTAYHAVSFVETFTGRPFYSLAPREQDVSIIDIAHALSNQCRYSGHTESMYSTAQHCCLLADYVQTKRKGTPLDCYQILLHDSAEAYLVDVPRPIKQFMPEYRKWDYDVTMCIRRWAGLGAEAIPSWQDELDSRIIGDEREQVMGHHDTPLDWEHPAPPLGIVVEPWAPTYAEQQFLARYAMYGAMIFGKPQYLRSAWGTPINPRSVLGQYMRTDVRSRYTPFQTGGSDVAQYGSAEPATVTDLLEVDFRGGVGRVALRSPDGMMIRDTSAGRFPRPAWKFIHGKFELMEDAGNGVG